MCERDSVEVRSHGKGRQGIAEGGDSVERQRNKESGEGSVLLSHHSSIALNNAQKTKLEEQQKGQI